MRIGFDLDKVFVDYPPFIPSAVIEWLYRHSLKEIFKKDPKSIQNLHYKIPKRGIEKWLRQRSHFYLFRPKISGNIGLVNNFPKNPHHHDLYLISSRYSFLEDLTLKLLKKYHLISPFVSINLNTNDEQPHLFKARKLKELGIELYIDDDLPLLEYLKDNCPQTQVVWYNPKIKANIYKGIPVIRNLEGIRDFLPK